MIPMRKWHGTRSASCWSWSTPLSDCVRVTSPCTISLNIPSPPTHTTLRKRHGIWLYLVKRRHYGNTWMHMNAMLWHSDSPLCLITLSLRKGIYKLWNLQRGSRNGTTLRPPGPTLLLLLQSWGWKLQASQRGTTTFFCMTPNMLED